jgi:hypothetical protein
LVSADPVLEWNAIAETTVATVDPAAQVRSTAITQLAVFDAVNSIVGGYEPYLAKVNAPPGASPEAAVIAAAHRALAALHPDQRANLDALQVASLSALPGGPARSDGVMVGIAAADAILTQRAGDRFDLAVPYTPTTNAGKWQPTPPDYTPAFRPGLGRLVPFGINHGAQFRVSPPPSPLSDKYVRDYREVKEAGDARNNGRPPDRAAVARFYEVTDAVPIYFPAARQVSAAQRRTVAENARIFALLGMAICDGAIACFESKYFYNYWRPVAAIRAGDTDGNDRTPPDAGWQPMVFTPPFPSYPSGHASFGGAARRVLEHVFGEDGHDITLRNALAPEVVLHYTAFEQITDDIDDARVYGGVHFRFDQEAGARQGKRVGDAILKHALRPLHGCECREKQ